MGAVKTVLTFIKKRLFNPKWKCVVCGKEIFDGEYFCADCEKSLPYNDKITCKHCGRAVVAPEEYCTTCKNVIVSVNKGASAFTYGGAIQKLIHRYKYFSEKYLTEVFGKYILSEYRKADFSADVITFIPMTDKALKTRGYNQSQLLAENLSEKINVPCENLLFKRKETAKQASSTRAERLKNLKDAFRVLEKSAVNGKKVLIVDDVTTTGATAEAAAEKLKNAGATEVFLLTLSSVPPKCGY